MKHVFCHECGNWFKILGYHTFFGLMLKTCNECTRIENMLCGHCIHDGDTGGARFDADKFTLVHEDDFMFTWTRADSDAHSSDDEWVGNEADFLVWLREEISG